MAAKLLHSLTDDNPDLQKQIGCMTGIFQLFDRQHMLTTRRITGHSPRRLLPGPGGSHFNGGTLETESNILYSRSGAVEKHSSKHLQEKQRLSTESSRASFSSSSCSSSFSSLDYNKTTQPEPLSFDRIIFPETPSGEPGMSQTASPQLGRQTADLRELVKDSMYREAHGLPVKTAARGEAADSLFKHRDSPRPMQFSRANDRSYGLGLKGKQDLPVDLKESLRVLSKLQETPWYANEPRELSRSASYQSKDGSFFLIAKEAPRFSYDGRDMRHASFESRDVSKSSLKFKEQPRLSLDSRENSMRSFKSDSQPFLNPSQRDSGSSNHNIPSQQQTSGNQVRPPSVVAKLMGLEALPSSVSSSESKMSSEKTCSVKDSGRSSKSSNTTDSCRPIQVSNPSKNSWKEPNSPRWKNPDSTLKPASRFPIEPAPWKQPDGNRTSQNSASKNMKAPPKALNSFPSVYSEIEKRLKDLEFSQSGKDLRALKQILEAMQAKGLLEGQKGEDQTFATQNDIERRYMNSMSGARLVNQQKLQNDLVSTSTKRGTNFSRNFESPIVIMKPAKLVEKSGIPASSVISLDDLSNLPEIQDGAFVDSRKTSVNGRAARDQIPKSTTGEKVSNNMKTNPRILKSTQTSARTSQSSKENNTGSLKSSGSISPRMQQKRQELERRSRPPIPPSDSSRSRRRSNKQGTESSSPSGRQRPKSTNLQQIDDQLCEISNESRNLSYYENESSAQSDGSILSELRTDIEVTSSERSPEMSSCQSPSMKPAHHSVSGLMEKKSSRGIPSEDELLMEHPVDAPEYPSPVSVLDIAVDTDDSPSPIKHIPKARRDDEAQESDTVSSSEQCKPADSLTTEAVGSGPTSEINRKKLQNIENLVQKLRRLNSSHDEARTDYIASLCENTNPDHRYISEILLASGLLLRDLGSSLTNFQFHPSGHPINPELFLVLEQTKARNFSKEECAPEKAVQLWSKEKIHRKLIFDTINEILARKLSFLGPSSEPWLKPHKLARKTLNAQKLLRELCLETEELQAKKSKCSLEDEDDGLRNILWEDVMHRSESWTDFNGEISSIVLDVERLIFKDLVAEVVIGEAPGLKNKPVRRRQLFAK